MIKPWSEWQRMVRAGTMLGETFDASRSVVGHRQTLIAAAISDPLGADLAELGRMVSEKAEAFGAAGTALSQSWLAMQHDLAAQWSDMSAMMVGQWPGPRKTRAMVARGQRLGSAAVTGSVRAMTPIHRAATANQKRLANGKR